MRIVQQGTMAHAQPHSRSLVPSLRLAQHSLAEGIPASRLSEQEIEQKLLQRELEIARQIQESLLPRTFPELPGFELAGFCKSARHVGGDFFDVIPLDDHAVVLVVADVMGKGVPAALFAATLRTLLRTMVQWTERPGDLLARINRLMFQELSSVDMFITVQVVVVDTQEQKLTIANAGHCPLLLSRGSQLEVFAPEGLPLGILCEAVYQESVVPMNDSTYALLYSDGLTEARNPDGEHFGQHRLEEFMTGPIEHGKSAETLKQEIVSALRNFEHLGASRDDQTFIVLKASHKPAKANVPTVTAAEHGEADSPLAAGVRALANAAEVATQTAETVAHGGGQSVLDQLPDCAKPSTGFSEEPPEAANPPAA